MKLSDTDEEEAEGTSKKMTEPAEPAMLGEHAAEGGRVVSSAYAAAAAELSTAHAPVPDALVGARAERGVAEVGGGEKGAFSPSAAGGAAIAVRTLAETSAGEVPARSASGSVLEVTAEGRAQPAPSLAPHR